MNVSRLKQIKLSSKIIMNQIHWLRESGPSWPFKPNTTSDHQTKMRAFDQNMIRVESKAQGEKHTTNTGPAKEYLKN